MASIHFIQIKDSEMCVILNKKLLQRNLPNYGKREGIHIHFGLTQKRKSKGNLRAS